MQQSRSDVRPCGSEAPNKRCGERPRRAEVHKFAGGGQPGRCRPDIDFVQDVENVDLEVGFVEAFVEVTQRQSQIEVGDSVSRQFDRVDVVKEPRSGALDLGTEFNGAEFELRTCADRELGRPRFALPCGRRESRGPKLDVFFDFRLQIRTEDIEQDRLGRLPSDAAINPVFVDAAKVAGNRAIRNRVVCRCQPIVVAVEPASNLRLDGSGLVACLLYTSDAADE